MIKKYFNTLCCQVTESLNDSVEIIDINIYDNENELIGSSNGVLYTEDDELFNLLKSENASLDALQYFKSKPPDVYLPIAILQNVNIYEEHRKQGYGKMALDQFIKKAILMEAKGVLLIADLSEKNEINLIKWYEKNGFITIGKSGINPIMVFKT